MSIEELVIDYVKEFKSGTLSQLIRYISTFAEEFKVEIEKIKQNLIELSEKNIINFNPDTTQFELINTPIEKTSFQVKTPFKWSGKLIGRIENFNVGSIDVNVLLELFKKRIEELATMKTIRMDEKEIYIEFNIYDVRIDFRIFSENVFEISAYSFAKTTISNPILLYMQKINEKEADKISKLPASMGIHLLFLITDEIFRKEFPNSKLNITDIAYIRMG